MDGIAIGIRLLQPEILWFDQILGDSIDAYRAQQKQYSKCAYPAVHDGLRKRIGKSIQLIFCDARNSETKPRAACIVVARCRDSLL
jgi:hypothetical protein